MPHTVEFKKAHLSIGGLDTTVLPDFTILTGINGSGKSHLLLGLKAGAFDSDCTKNHGADILLTNWHSIIPDNSTKFSSLQRVQAFEQKLPKITQQLKRIRGTVRRIILHLGFPQSTKLSADFLIAVKYDSNLLETYPNLGRQQIPHSRFVLRFNEQIRGIAIAVEQMAPTNPSIEAQKQFEKRMIDILYMKDDQVLEIPSLVWQKTEPFKQSFSHLFGTYRDLLGVNLKKLGAEVDGMQEANPLSNDQFITTYGRPPWDIVNEIFATANLDFKISKPDIYNDYAFTAQLTKVSTGADVSFSTLSSGEKVIMSFAICLFNGIDERQNARFPKLLLLDEIDAPLHPSMVRGLLKTIREIFIEKFGVKVIMTTHNPTTVALADEECLFEMALPKLEKVSKDRALNLLTVGVPMLAVSYEGRRQVFVESVTDSKLYTKLYDQYRSELASERSLTFIPVGKRKELGGKVTEENSGCSQVVSIVKNLTDAGTTSVRGLVDWDKKNRPKDNVHVLSEGLRYSIENCVLDPALLTLALVHDRREYCQNVLKLRSVGTIREMDDWSDEVWQANVDMVVKTLLGSAYSTFEHVSVTYLNGRVLQISKGILEMNGHKLEELVLENLSFARSFEKTSLHNDRSLPIHIVKKILPEYREFLPSDIWDSFQALLES